MKLNQKFMKHRGYKIEGSYLYPEKRIINPLGIVLQGVVHRLICTMDDSPDLPRHLPFIDLRKLN